jgi:hypothetical protein
MRQRWEGVAELGERGTIVLISLQVAFVVSLLLQPPDLRVPSTFSPSRICSPPPGTLLYFPPSPSKTCFHHSPAESPPWALGPGPAPSLGLTAQLAAAAYS